jgi:hypothetical protein
MTLLAQQRANWLLQCQWPHQHCRLILNQKWIQQLTLPQAAI